MEGCRTGRELKESVVKRREGKEGKEKRKKSLVGNGEKEKGNEAKEIKKENKVIEK